MLTWSGRVLAVLAAVLVLAGVGLDYPEILTVGFACLLALIVAGGWMLVRPSVVAVREISPRRVAEGDPAQGLLTLRNEGRHRSPPVIATEHVAGRDVVVPLPSLGRGAEHRTSYPLPTGRRGVFTVGPLTIGHSDPLMLMHTAVDVASRSTLTVHPRVHRVLPLPAGQSQDFDGPTSSSAPRGGIAFHQLSEYVPGDDIRLIHWLTSARTGTLMVRHNAVPNEPRLTVILDTSEDPYTDQSFEDAVRAAASLCMAACRAGYPLLFRTTGGVVNRWERGSAGRDGLLDTLASVERAPSDRGLAALSASTSEPNATSLAVVTGSPGAAGRARVEAIGDRFQMVIMVQIGRSAEGRRVGNRGIVTLSASSSEDFAALWNRQVRV